LSELENFLAEQAAEGYFDSSGEFSLSRDKALAKLSAYQLPRPCAWILKIVSAAQVMGASRLVIRSGSHDVDFQFEGPCTWDYAQVEEAIFDPLTTPDSSLDHFKRALWATGLNEMRPFRVLLPGMPQALIWDGRQICYQAASECKGLYLQISHRNVFERSAMAALQVFDNFQRNQVLSDELRDYAFTAPFELSYNGRRFDSLWNCPSHGYTDQSLPIFLGFNECDAPHLPLSPGTFEAGQVRSRLAKLHKKVGPLLPPQKTVQSACLLSIHLRADAEADSGWQLRRQEPILYWVRDGIVVAREILKPGPWSVSAALFASASDLEVDLTGFQLRKDEARWARRRLLVEQSHLHLLQLEIDLGDLVRWRKNWARVKAAAWAGTGLFLTPSMPWLGLPMTGKGVYELSLGGQAELALETSLKADLDTLRRQWLAR
jgi:hypothetical protein